MSAIVLLLGLGASAFGQDGDIYQIGVARQDVTPDYPIRLNGFGFRREESEGVNQRIWAKALAIGADDERPLVLITLDSLGIRLPMVDEVAARLQRKAGVERARIAVAFSHSHTTPKVNGASNTIFSTPIPEAHQRHIDQYTAELTDHLERVALAALADRRPARLQRAVGTVGFAKNRRTAGGPIDHDLPTLFVRDLDGKVRAVYVSYACHCVTLSHNLIGGDWAGYAQDLVERRFPGAVALVAIGAGSDQNPTSGVTGDKVDVATAQGAQIADEVARLAAGPLQDIRGKWTAEYQTIDLPLEPAPTPDELRQLIEKQGPPGYNAQVQLARLERGEALLDKITYPVQTWAAGDQLALVFLGGEVCVDYSLRLKRELDASRLWLLGYSNDFCCYIPSERLLQEGGYGGGAETVYFDLPSKLRPGMEQRIIDEVRRQAAPFLAKPAGAGAPAPKSPAESIAAMRPRDGMRVELVAAEPLVADPVTIDFGADGRLWVVEMPDYARPVDAEFEPQGQVKVLRDVDGDGRFDEAQVYVDKLRFPTDAKAWRDGVLVCDAPDILFCRDTDGDGRADSRELVCTGFATHNPHARVNSLRLGLDGWLYGSGGLFGGLLRTSDGREVDTNGRDFRLRPDTGELEAVTGRTQQGRVRDDGGRWFGCTNSQLLLNYPLEDAYLRRNPFLAPPATVVQVANGFNSQLFPAGELVTFKLSGPPGRPTSACGLEIYRDELLGSEYTGNAFVCEPVNQLVHREVLVEEEIVPRGERGAGEESSEFLSSTDQWFRPVQVRTGPDGALWVVDMYRYVIEHPQWIPPETIATLDVFAGRGLGRIYRVLPARAERRPAPDLEAAFASSEPAKWLELLDSPNGTVRDLVAERLFEVADERLAAPLLDLIEKSPRWTTQAQGVALLDTLALRERVKLVDAPRLARFARGCERPEVLCQLLRLAEHHAGVAPELAPMRWLAELPTDNRVRQQLAYALGAFPDDERSVAWLAALIGESGASPYLLAAAMSSVGPDNVEPLLRRIAAQGPECERQFEALLTTAVGLKRPALTARAIGILLATAEERPTWCLNTLARLLRSGDEVRAALDEASRQGVATWFERARAWLGDDEQPAPLRQAAARLLGGGSDEDLRSLGGLLAARTPLPLQQVAIEGLAGRATDTSAALLLEAWTAATPAVREALLAALISRPAWARRLLDAVEAGQIPASDLGGSRAQVLARLDDADRERAARLLQGGSGEDRAAVVARFRPATTRAGDVEHGREVFKKSCGACHRLGEVGHAVGPDIAGLTSRTPEAFLVAILDPNRDVDGRYLSYVGAQEDGRVLVGMLAEETATSITLVEDGEKKHVVLRNELVRLRSSGKSLMPEGLEKDWQEQDLADLLALLATIGPRPKTLAGNRPETARWTGAPLELSASTAEIYGDEIIYEQSPGTIGYWHGERDQVVWRVQVESPVTCDVELEWSCAADSAGNRYRMEVAGQTLRGAVASTGGWDKLRRSSIGQITLPPGEHALVVRSDGPLTRRALFDLKSVRLIPR